MSRVINFLKSDLAALCGLGLLAWMPLIAFMMLPSPAPSSFGSPPMPLLNLDKPSAVVFSIGWLGGGITSLLHAQAKGLNVAYKIGLATTIFLPRFLPVTGAVYWVVSIALPLYWIVAVVVPFIRD